MNDKPSPKLLDRALKANAICSLILGIGAIVFAQQIGQWMGMAHPWILYVVGASLIPFAGMIFFVAKRKYPKRREVLFICALDLAWVLGVTDVLLFDLYKFSTAGYWVTAISAVLVFDFMVLQLIGLKRSGPLAV